MHLHSWLLETRRSADLDVRMCHATRPMWVAGGNLWSAYCGNDQDVIDFSGRWLLFVPFQPLRLRIACHRLKAGSERVGLRKIYPHYEYGNALCILGCFERISALVPAV